MGYHDSCYKRNIERFIERSCRMNEKRYCWGVHCPVRMSCARYKAGENLPSYQIPAIAHKFMRHCRNEKLFVHNS